MPTESAPPIHDLPDEIEAALVEIARVALDLGRMQGSTMDVPYRVGIDDEYTAAFTEARHAIRTTLNDQDAALRERCERLRMMMMMRLGPETRENAVAIGYLQPGDLADNLIPRKGDVLP